MPIYTKTTFICAETTMPDTTSGIPRHPVLADHLFYAVTAGHTTLTADFVLGEKVDGKQEYTIVREWFDAEQAQIWADLTTASVPKYPDEPAFPDLGFVSCVVVTE